MKPLASFICLLSIAFNTVLAYSGGVLFCEHETGDSHLVSRADHAAESHDEACHVENKLASNDHASDEECDSCTDTEVETKASLEKATLISDRSLVKFPATLAFVSLDERIATPPVCLLVLSSIPTRAPSTVYSAIKHYTDTIQYQL